VTPAGVGPAPAAAGALAVAWRVYRSLVTSLEPTRGDDVRCGRLYQPPETSKTSIRCWLRASSRRRPRTGTGRSIRSLQARRWVRPIAHRHPGKSGKTRCGTSPTRPVLRLKFAHQVFIEAKAAAAQPARTRRPGARRLPRGARRRPAMTKSAQAALEHQGRSTNGRVRQAYGCNPQWTYLPHK
jgi:hypothetical protein